MPTALDWFFNVLNRPLSAAAGVAQAAYTNTDPFAAAMRGLSGEQQLNFGDVLQQQGVSNPRLKGFALDVALDPLNVVPVGKLGKFGLEAAGRGVDALAQRSDFVRGALKQVVPYYGLPTDYANQRRLLDTAIRYERGKAVDDWYEMLKGTSDKDRKALAYSLEEGPISPAFRENAGQLNEVRKRVQDQFAKIAQTEIDAGVLDEEKVRDVLNQYGGYVPYIFNNAIGKEGRHAMVPTKFFRTVSARNRFNSTRELESFKQAAELGADVDIARVGAVRQYGGAKAVRTQNFLKDLIQNPEWAKPLGGADVPLDWRPVRVAAETPFAQTLGNVAFAPEIADDLEKILSMPEARGALGKAYDDITNVWKGYATTLKPGFHLRNLVSNVFNSWLGGLNPLEAPARYAEALSWRAGVKQPIAGMAPEQLDEAMNIMGVRGQEFGGIGELGDIMSRRLDNMGGPSLGQQANPLSQDFLPQRMGRRLGSEVEDVSRMALFFDQLHKGATPQQAALHVKKYLFDYQELTDVERKVFRRVVPFYTWIRKNVPLQVKGLVTQPEVYSKVGAALSETEGATEDAGLTSDWTPEFLQKLNAPQLPGVLETGERFWLNPNLPYQDLNRIPIPGVNGLTAMTDQIASMNPLLKAPIEWALNKQFFQQRPIYRDSPQELTLAPPAMQAIANALPPETAQAMGFTPRMVDGKLQWHVPANVAYAGNQLPVFSNLGKAAVSVGDPKAAGAVPGTHTPLTPEGINPLWLDFFLGIKAMPQSDQQLMRDRRYTLQDQRRLQRRQAREASSTISPEAVEWYRRSQR